MYLHLNGSQAEDVHPKGHIQRVVCTLFLHCVIDIAFPKGYCECPREVQACLLEQEVLWAGCLLGLLQGFTDGAKILNAVAASCILWGAGEAQSDPVVLVTTHCMRE